MNSVSTRSRGSVDSVSQISLRTIHVVDTMSLLLIRNVVCSKSCLGENPHAMNCNITPIYSCLVVVAFRL